MATGAAVLEIVLVHTGTDALPVHLRRVAAITARVAPGARLTLLVNRPHCDAVQGWDAAFNVVCIDDLPSGAAHQQFAASSALNRQFRGGFWYRTTQRFFVLADYMRSTDARNVIHLENDVLLHCDLSQKLQALQTHARFAVPLDRKRAIASIVWLADSGVADVLAQYLLDVPSLNDMEALNGFVQAHPELARPLPTLPLTYARAKGLDEQRFCAGLEAFGGIFDAAAIGQYLGGVDRQNNPHDSRFFINESSELDLRECGLVWDVNHGLRQPVLHYAGESTPVLCLHAHSKDVLALSPFNHGVPTQDAQLLTGERLQALADLTLSTPAITAFHGRDHIRSNALAEIGQNAQQQLLVPDAALIAACQQARVLFVYTHLLEYFRLYIAPCLQQPFVLISHNSRHSVGLQDLDLLNHPQLVHWWAQNVDVAHTRLSALPIGLANRQWGAAKLEQLLAASKSIHKDRLLYANVALTHSLRVQALAAAKLLAGATFESGLDYPAYLASMARHQFCLCPRGNGLDSHRLWEALYLDCIPIIVKADWTAAYSGLPLLVLEHWEALPTINLAQAYQRIKATACRLDSLRLAHYAQAVAQARARAAEAPLTENTHG
jgi:hypothetical protein